MTIYKRGRVYWVEYVVGGIRHRKSCHTRNKAAAQAWVDSITTARKMPTFEEAVEVLRMIYRQQTSGSLTLAAAWDAYSNLAHATGKDEVAESTMRRRENCFRNLVSWIEENAATVNTVERVSGAVAAKYAEHLANSGLKTKTRRNIIGELSTVWALLEKRGENIHNPWHDLAPKDTDGEIGKAFTVDQEESVLAAAKEVGKDWWAVCTIMRHTGLRYGSVARLKWSEVQGDVIRHTPPKTKRHGITVVLPVIAPIRAALDSLDQRDDYLFPLHAELYGNRGRASREALNFAEVLTRAGISGKGYTVHSWRHTTATRLAETGADIETRKRILGHTEDATARRYDHADHIDEMRSAIEAASR